MPQYRTSEGAEAQENSNYPRIEGSQTDISCSDIDCGKAVRISLESKKRNMLYTFLINSDSEQGVLLDCLQSQIGTVVKQSVLSLGFAFDEFWHFSKKFDTLISF